MTEESAERMQRERTIEFIATIHWDADSQWDDVLEIQMRWRTWALRHAHPAITLN